MCGPPPHLVNAQDHVEQNVHVGLHHRFGAAGREKARRNITKRVGLPPHDDVL